jgi:16S rRNA (guanine966-N2)-methyltransferase
MRIIAGVCRGKRLHSLKGQATRPTSDRVKEAVFSMVAPYLGSAYVLDAFAGSGALGLEALSRGAAQVWFCEDKTAAARVVAENIAACRLPGARLFRGYFFTVLPQLRDKHPGLGFDVIFLDPPYRSNYIERAALLIQQGNWLAEDGVMVAESSSSEGRLDNDAYQLIKEKKYGDTTIRFYQLAQPSATGGSHKKEEDR